jgi:3-hydroxyisobutyrate dehydrogenase
MPKDNVVVGFVGLGTMGGRMAANVQRAGFKLVVHDLHRQAASHHLFAGAIWADSPRALAREADVIFSSLPEPSDVEAVALGETASSLASSPALPISTCRPIRRVL